MYKSITCFFVLILSVPIVSAQECATSFDAVVEQHTNAVDERDLERYIATIAPRESQMMILPDGSFFKSLDEIRAWHKGWFADESWTFNKTLVRKDARATWGLVVYNVTVDRTDSPGSPFLLSMLFAPEENGCWYLQHDQNTLVQAKSE